MKIVKDDIHTSVGVYSCVDHIGEMTHMADLKNDHFWGVGGISAKVVAFLEYNTHSHKI